jgi:poly(A) polymerase
VSTAEEQLTAIRRQAIDELIAGAPIVADVGARFQAAGHDIALVGGSVRDALLDRTGRDLDFATSARPDDIERCLLGWADATWDIGRDFGTIGAQVGDWRLEITTYRSDAYDASSRKPAVTFGDTLDGDLSRRDFTINAMAVQLPSREFVDPFGGTRDLAVRLLRTPSTPEQSFSDDPLRMLRAARFAAQLDLRIDPGVTQAMRGMASRISIVSAERVRDELTKLIQSPLPRTGLTLLVDSGLAEVILPELPALRLERDEHHRHKDVYEHTLTVLEQAISLEPRLGGAGPDLVTRLAALLHDIGKPATRRFAEDGTVAFHHHDVVGAKLARRRLTALRYPAADVDAVCRLVELHLRFHGYGSGEWTDSAVRRYVRDAGPLLSRLHVLTRADCTTRNARKAERLRRTYDDLQERIARLSAEEELAAIRPELDGREIMEVLGIAPGPDVGVAYRFLLELRLDEGPVGPERAREALLAWWPVRSQVSSTDDSAPDRRRRPAAS